MEITKERRERRQHHEQNNEKEKKKRDWGDWRVWILLVFICEGGGKVFRAPTLIGDNHAQSFCTRLYTWCVTSAHDIDHTFVLVRAMCRPARDCARRS